MDHEPLASPGMEYRTLGRSGMEVSELTYGNWVTQGSQIGEDAAVACVQAALECGVTSFDTADVYARGRAEEVLGRALKGERRDGAHDEPEAPRMSAALSVPRPLVRSTH